MDRKKLLITGFLLVTTVLLIGCVDEGKDNGYSNDRTYRVTYKVTGFAVGVSVTYENEDGGTSQIGDTWIPWQKVIYDMHKGDFVYLSAQNNGDYGYITVEIYINGMLFKSSSSTGGYVIATASGII